MWNITKRKRERGGRDVDAIQTGEQRSLLSSWQRLAQRKAQPISLNLQTTQRYIIRLGHCHLLEAKLYPSTVPFKPLSESYYITIISH